MPKVNLYKEYLKSESWKCPEGGGHHWVCMEEASEKLKSKSLFVCLKCEEVREFYTTYDAAANATAKKLGTTLGLLEMQARAEMDTSSSAAVLPHEMMENIRKKLPV